MMNENGQCSIIEGMLVAGIPFSLTDEQARELPPLNRVLYHEWRKYPRTLARLSAECGLGRARIREIFTGVTPNPGVLTLLSLLQGMGRNLAWLEQELLKTERSDARASARKGVKQKIKPIKPAADR
jgi:hypothetical protein